LNLSKTNITDVGLFTLRQFAGPTLRSLELDEVLDVTNEGMKLFFEPEGGVLQLGKVRAGRGRRSNSTLKENNYFIQEALSKPPHSLRRRFQA
jgi:hypothetical protein